MLLGYLIYDEIKTSKEDKEHKENIKKLEEKEQSNLNDSETISSVTNENDE